jgi:hypothetical protein
MVVVENRYELPSQAIRRAKSCFIYRLLSNFKFGLTVKIRNRMTKKSFYRHIHRQIDSLGAIDADRQRNVNLCFSMSCADTR